MAGPVRLRVGMFYKGECQGKHFSLGRKGEKISLTSSPCAPGRHVLPWYGPHLFAFWHGLFVMQRRQSVCETERAKWG